MGRSIAARGPGKGVLITLEGGEGSGKSTQAARLAARLAQAGRTVVRTSEPAGIVSELIRRLLGGDDREHWDAKLATLLFLAARLMHWRKTIGPALESGAWVVSDRFHDSTTAYQGAGQGIPAEELERLSGFVFEEGTDPDLTLVLDVGLAESFARVSARERAGRPQAPLFGGEEWESREGKRRAKAQLDRFEAADDAFHERVRRAFLDIAKANPERCRVIDASPSEEEVEERIWQAVEERFGEALGRAG